MGIFIYALIIAMLCLLFFFIGYSFRKKETKIQPYIDGKYRVTATMYLENKMRELEIELTDEWTYENKNRHQDIYALQEAVKFLSEF